MRIEIKRLPSAGTDIPLPVRMSTDASGVDIEAAVDESVSVPPSEWRAIPTGFALAVPSGCEVQVRPRSGLAREFGVTVLNSPGTIDSDFRGEIEVLLINHGLMPFEVARGMRIAQLVVAQVVEAEFVAVSDLPPTDRGSHGFGHTGLR